MPPDISPPPLAADPACDPAAEPCTVRAAEKAVTLRLEGAVRPLQPFTVRVTLAGWEAVEKVSVRFAMPGMEMGLNRFGLRQANGGWQGQALLPACSMGRRDWRITVEVVGKALYTAEFSTVLDG